MPVFSTFGGLFGLCVQMNRDKMWTYIKEWQQCCPTKSPQITFANYVTIIQVAKKTSINIKTHVNIKHVRIQQNVNQKNPNNNSHVSVGKVTRIELDYGNIAKNARD